MWMRGSVIITAEIFQTREFYSDRDQWRALVNTVMNLQVP
jgi:hypothetical protein